METSGIGSSILALAFFKIALTAIFNAISLVFAICYAFSWDKMREWFNKKAGINFMQKERLETEQGFMLMVGIAIGVLIAIFNMISLDAWVLGLESISFTAVFIWGVIKFVKEKSRLGKKAAFWSAMFNFLANITVVSFSVYLSYIAICLFVVMLLFGGITKASLSPISTSSSNSQELKSGIHGKSEDGDDLVLEDRGNNHFRDQHGRDYGRNLDGSYFERGI